MYDVRRAIQTISALDQSPTGEIIEHRDLLREMARTLDVALGQL